MLLDVQYPICQYVTNEKKSEILEFSWNNRQRVIQKLSRLFEPKSGVVVEVIDVPFAPILFVVLFKELADNASHYEFYGNCTHQKLFMVIIVVKQNCTK